MSTIFAQRIDQILAEAEFSHGGESGAEKIWNVDHDVISKSVFLRDADDKVVGRFTHIKGLIIITHKPSGQSYYYIITKKGNVYDSRDAKDKVLAADPYSVETSCFTKSVDQAEAIADLEEKFGLGNGKAIFGQTVREMGGLNTAKTTTPDAVHFTSRHPFFHKSPSIHSSTPKAASLVVHREIYKKQDGTFVNIVHINPAVASKEKFGPFFDFGTGKTKGVFSTKEHPEIAKLIGAINQWFMIEPPPRKTD